ncbi:helix-turn-helix domain-containing protein [Brenneria goodwinii]
METGIGGTDQGNVVLVITSAMRHATGLSQTKFANLIDVNVATLQNWEQGRRDPTGLAKALLRAIERDPEHVISALAAGR